MKAIRASLSALVLAAAALTAAAAEYPSLTVKVAPIRVAPSVYYVQGQAGIASAANEGYNSNAGFVVTDEGVVVIDALGTPALGNALLQAIRSVTPKPLKRVILTHYHADHYYGLEALKRAGAEAWADSAAEGVVESDEAKRRLEQRARDLFPWVDEKMALLKADRWLARDEAFTLGGVRFEVIRFGPAHSPEDLVVWLPAQRIVFCGDILFAGRIPFVGDADGRAWLQRIERLLAMDPRVVVTGHGPVSHDPRTDLSLTRDYLTFVRAAMGKAAAELVPFEEAYARTDWSRFAKVPAFEAANRVNAFGQYLAMERELLKK